MKILLVVMIQHVEINCWIQGKICVIVPVIVICKTLEVLGLLRKQNKIIPANVSCFSII